MMLFIIIVYLLAMLFIGWWSSRHYIKGMSDFLLAGRRLGFWLCAFTLAATHVGPGFCLGGGEHGYNMGVSGGWYGMACGVGLLFLFLTAGKFRELSFYTLPDYLEKRYGGKAIRALGALISAIALTGLVGACALGAKTIFGMLGIEGNWGFFVAAVVILVYTTSGGLWAVTLTDFLQLSITLIGVIIGAIVVLAKTGGMAGLNSMLAAKGVEPGYFNLFGMGAKGIIWVLLPTVMYTLIGQDFYQRLFAAKDARVARRATIGSGLLLVVLSFFPVIIGMGARALGDIESGAQALPWVLQNLTHPVFGGIVLAGVLAAVMSSADSLLTAATAHVVKDFWVEVFHLGTMDEEKKLLKVSRIATVILGVIAVIIAVVIPSLITIIIYSYITYTAAVFVPVIGGLLWKRATNAGALTALIGGAIATLAGILSKADIFGIPSEIYGAIVSLVLFVVVSLATKPAKAAA
jgi:SSS family solute:Na+ symporter